MWDWRVVIGVGLAVSLSACGAEIAGESSAPTLPPLILPAVPPTVPRVPAASTPDAAVVDLPEILDLAAFDVFGRLDVERYEVAFSARGNGIDQTATYTFQREPRAGRILGVADGDAVEVVIVGDSVWVRFGPTPNGSLVEATSMFAGLPTDFFEPGAIIQNLEPFGFKAGDFVLVGRGEFEGLPAYEYAVASPRVFSWWVNGDGVIVGGTGQAGEDDETTELSFVYRWDGQIAFVGEPENTITQDEYFAFLAFADPAGLQADLQFVRAALERVQAASGAFATDELDGMVRVGLIDGWQVGFADLAVGVIGVELTADSALLVGVMADGRHYCVATDGDSASYGGGYELADVNTVELCSEPGGFPTIDPPG